MIKPINQVETKEEIQEYYDYYHNLIFKENSFESLIKELVEKEIELRRKCTDRLIQLNKMEDKNGKVK